MLNANQGIRIAEVTSRRGAKRCGFTWTELLVCLAIIALVVALVLPATRRGIPRAAVRRMQCSNTLKQISLALLEYESKYKMFPPAYTLDADGNRLHSWRSLILPFLEQSDLYAKIDFTKAWNDPANEAVFRNSLPVYQCLASELPSAHTSYLAIVGESNCIRPQSGRMMTEIVDGLSNTVMIFETEPSKSVHWMCPEDASEDMFVAAGPKSKTAHTGGRFAGMADGSVRFLSLSVPEDQLRGLASIDGREAPYDSN